MTHSNWSKSPPEFSIEGNRLINPYNEGATSALTSREVEILQHVMLGCTSKVIAEKIGISFRTVETYRSRLMLKMGAKRTSDLVRLAVQAIGNIDGRSK